MSARIMGWSMPYRLLWPAAGVGTLAAIALLTPLLGLPNPVRQDVAQRLTGPGADALLGRDEFGRDVLSRLLWGARTSLSVAFAAASAACIIGTTLGLLGGWFRGIGEILTVRVADVILCFPPILLALLAVTLLGPGAATLIIMLTLLYIPGFIRVTYGEVLTARNQDFVEAVRALGAGNIRILLRTILPNIAGPVLVQFSLTVAAAIVVESGLSFLGLGVVPPTPSWGLMIRGARATMAQAPLLLVWPCLALTFTILAMNLLCDALRDMLDPRSRSASAYARPVLDRLLPGLMTARQHPSGLDVRGLTVAIETSRGVIQPVRDLSFAVAPGETLAIVGESGSGKSVTATALMGLLPPGARATQGQVMFDGDDLLSLSEDGMRKLRGQRIAMIFQDPMSSLNPVQRIGRQIGEAILAHRPMTGALARQEALGLLRRVGIADPERRIDAYPHELSGGMRQRIMIAMAVANRPQLLIADEPTTALDVTVQAQILELLADLKRETGMSMIFVTHSLGVISEIADRVLVMYAGEMVEEGPVPDVFSRPLHPYTKALLMAVADGHSKPSAIPGMVPAPHELPAGCRFQPRCAFASDACARPQAILDAGAGRQVRCHRAEALMAMAGGGE
jgi:peptide/nickel transport system permease protein